MESIPARKIRTVTKGTLLLHKGDVCMHGFGVLKGCLRSYVIDRAGKEHILQFAPEGWYISDIESIIFAKPSAIFIDAIEDSEIQQYSRDDINDTRNLDHDTLADHNQKLIRNLITTQRRVAALLSYTAEERYTAFIETYPNLMQRLPLRYIASYLGMTPEYLSEVRRKMSQK